MITIAIADDHALFKAGIIELLQTQPDMQVLFSAPDGRTFLNTLTTAPASPDIALIDLEMPQMNGRELTQKMRDQFPLVKTIILSAFDQERYIHTLIDSGASAFLSKNCGTGALFEAIRQTYQYGFYMTAGMFKAMQHIHATPKVFKTINNIPVGLTQREMEILKLICGENTNQEISEQLFISTRTVEGHRNNLLLKTGARNTAGLVLFAIRHGIAGSLY